MRNEMWRCKLRKKINEGKYEEALREIKRIYETTDWKEENDKGDNFTKWFLCYETALIYRKLGKRELCNKYLDIIDEILVRDTQLVEFYKPQLFKTLWLRIENNRNNYTMKYLYKLYNRLLRVYKDFDDDDIHKISAKASMCEITKDYNGLIELYDICVENNYISITNDIKKVLENNNITLLYEAV